MSPDMQQQDHISKRRSVYSVAGAEAATERWPDATDPLGYSLGVGLLCIFFNQRWSTSVFPSALRLSVGGGLRE